MDTSKAISQILEEKTEEVFRVVSETFALGGGNPSAKAQVESVLDTVWALSRKYRNADIARELKDFIDFKVTGQG